MCVRLAHEQTSPFVEKFLFVNLVVMVTNLWIALVTIPYNIPYIFSITCTQREIACAKKYVR